MFFEEKEENYGPVSNLSFNTNCLENVVLQQAHHSTETLLPKTANDIPLGHEKRHVSLLTLLDLSSAIETIDLDIVLNRLIYLYEFSDTYLSLFLSYLSNRRQSVAIAKHNPPT